MRRILYLAIFAALSMAGCAHPPTMEYAEVSTMSDNADALTVERLFASPSLNGASARGVKFSPDGKRLTFLRAKDSDANRLDLWAFDIATGALAMLVDSRLLEPEDIELSEEEKALRERKRIAGTSGIVSYDWGANDKILLPLGGDLHMVSLSEDGTSTQQLTQTDAFEYDAKVSPDGRYVSFIRDGAVYTVDLTSNVETRLSPAADPDNAVSYGVAEFVAQEEMSRYTGYWWSPDSRFVAFTRVDESPVDIIPRFDIAANNVTVIDQRYPRAGRPNAIVDLFVRDMNTGITRQIDWRTESWGDATDQYLARVNWADHVMHIQAVNRDQTEVLGISVAFDVETGASTQSRKTLETQSKWVNLSDDFISTEIGILRSDEQSGYRHIILAGKDGQTRPITHGDWAVSSLAGYDAGSQTIYFTGFKDTPLEKHLYSVSLSGGAPVRITEPGKSWAVAMSPDAKSFVGTSSSPSHPPQTGLYKPNGELIAWVEENALDESHPYFPYKDLHTTPDFGTLKSENGMDLYYSIQYPPDFNPKKKYPVIVDVYGGPHAQTVTRNWERISDQYYVQQGYILFRLDNRGSANRGKAFEDEIYHLTGEKEVNDQLAGINWLKDQPFVDADRVALQGWSYGGYMTLMTTLKAPEGTFAASVAGAPVTDWALYDTFYTERYMGTPENNAEGYEASSVFPYIDNLFSPLLLIHGMADDNVTFDNSTRLMARLQEKGKTFELMTYPGQRHGIRGEELQTHLMKTRMAFLNRHLKPESDEK